MYATICIQSLDATIVWTHESSQEVELHDIIHGISALNVAAVNWPRRRRPKKRSHYFHLSKSEFVKLGNLGVYLFTLESMVKPFLGAPP